MVPLPRPNCSRLLPRALTIPTIMDLVALADVRPLLGLFSGLLGVGA
jgi:hypothetical protein